MQVHNLNWSLNKLQKDDCGANKQIKQKRTLKHENVNLIIKCAANSVFNPCLDFGLCCDFASLLYLQLFRLMLYVVVLCLFLVDHRRKESAVLPLFLSFLCWWHLCAPTSTTSTPSKMITSMTIQTMGLLDCPYVSEKEIEKQKSVYLCCCDC